MGRIEDLLKKNLPGVYVHSIMVGSNVEEDELNGFLMNGNDQVSLICDRLKRDPVLNSSQSINAIGFSQGGQFIRGFVERCNVPQVKNLITLGAQHEGVYGLPNCPGPNTTLCEWARKLLDYGAYFSFIQEHITQAGYCSFPRRTFSVEIPRADHVI
jgi:palmitoyl-protein thioesterase